MGTSRKPSSESIAAAPLGASHHSSWNTSEPCGAGVRLLVCLLGFFQLLQESWLLDVVLKQAVHLQHKLSSGVALMKPITLRPYAVRRPECMLSGRYKA